MRAIKLQLLQYDYMYTLGVKSMSPVDIELLFVSISYNITALRLKIDIFLWKSSNLNKLPHNFST